MKKNSWNFHGRDIPCVKQICRVMKLTTFLLFVMFFQVSAGVFSQTSGEISLKAENESINNILKLIEEQTQYTFMFNKSNIDVERKTSINCNLSNIEDVLNMLFAGTDVKYRSFNHNFVLYKENGKAQLMTQQTGSVSGKVTDASGSPLPGVSVVIKGTTNGTITSSDGNFQLNKVPSDGTLIFSFIGMKTKEVEVNGQTEFNVNMEEDFIGLEEVVAVGYGVQKKKDLTGAVTVVKTDQLMRAPTTNAIEAMQGLVPGMTISRKSGEAGSGVDVLIRGNRSINGSNSPLFIVDGVQGINFEDINASDIESVNVLKDASSTAIYGSQGANGVVIITTKKGKAGKIKISYNGYCGINGFTEYPASRMGNDYIQLRREANRTAGIWSSAADDSKIFADYELQAIQNNQWTNWKDLVLRNGVLQNHVVTLSGGNDKLTSLLTIGYMNEQGQYKNDAMDKYTARLNLNYNITKWAKAGLNSQITYYNIDRRKDPINMSLYTSPFGEPYDENGNVNVYPIAGRSIISPLADEAPSVTAVDNRLKTNTNLNGYLEITPLEGLSYRSNLSIALSNSRNGSFFSSESIAKQGSSAEATYEASNLRYVNFDNILTYSKIFGAHSLKLTGLTSYIKSVSDNVKGSGLNQMLPSQLFYSLQSTDEGTKKIESGYEEYSSMSIAGRLNYSYQDKYLLTATLRYDGASRLAKGNQWDYFPSIGAAWRISEENFMKGLENVSNLKLRASYGMAGNSAIDPYGTQTTMSLSTGFSFGDETAPYYSIDTYGNPGLGWEKSKTTNIGIDYGMYKNRISLTADYYLTTTSDILLSRVLPWSDGGKNKNVFQNIGETKNKGLELSLKTVNFDRKDFKWSTSITYTRSSEKISKLIDGENIYWVNGLKTSLIIGQPIYTFYNYVSEGIWQTDEQAEMDKFNANGHNFKPGTIKVKDLNGDYKIDGDNDRAPVGHENPDWEGGINNTVKYKNFDLSLYVYARMGQTIWGEALGRYNADGLENGPAFIDYWTPEHPSNEYPRPDANISGIYQYQYADVLFLTDGSYVKLKNVSLGYTLPKTWLNRTALGSVRVYVTGSNLMTWVKDKRLKNYDPERGGSESSPLTRQLIFGVNVNL